MRGRCFSNRIWVFIVRSCSVSPRHSQKLIFLDLYLFKKMGQTLSKKNIQTVSGTESYKELKETKEIKSNFTQRKMGYPIQTDDYWFTHNKHGFIPNDCKDTFEVVPIGFRTEKDGFIHLPVLTETLVGNRYPFFLIKVVYKQKEGDNTTWIPIQVKGTYSHGVYSHGVYTIHGLCDVVSKSREMYEMLIRKHVLDCSREIRVEWK